MKSAALILVTLLFVLVAQAASIPYLQQPAIAHADPALSGAITAQVPNSDFSGVGLGDVGTPPTNYDIETARSSVGTPASNHDFATGDFTGWTLTGSPTIQSGGPGGNYAQLGSGQKITSSAFTVDSSAQTLTFNVGASTSTYDYDLVIKSGATYSTSTTKTFACYSSCSGAWTLRSLNAVAFQGQSIKVEIKRWGGTVNVDDAGLQNIELQNWTPAAGDKVTRQTGGPNGAYAETSTAITSAAFTVDASAQNASIEAKVASGSGAYSVTVLSGTNYATSTQVYTGSNGQSSWGTRSFGIGSFVGQSIKLKITPDSGTSIAVDKAGIGANVIPGWSPTGAEPVAVNTDQGQAHAAHVDWLGTGTFRLDGNGYNGTQRGNWFRVVYRLYENYNNFGTDLGSYLDVWDGQTSYWNYWGDTGKAAGAPYSPTRVWLEEYFFVAGDPNNPTTVSPRNVSFRVHGWGPTSPTCNPSCGGRPDLAVLEMVDGPGQNETLGNPSPLMARSLPDDFQAEEPTTLVSEDPVELTSGTYFQAKTDLAIPGRGVPLTFTRSYSATAATNALGTAGVMGAKWSHNWQASLTEVATDKAVRISLPLGASSVWYKVSGVWKPPVGVEGTLVKNGGGDWTLTTSGQLVYAFTSSGQWASVTDRNGNATSLSYTSGRLTSITDPASRSLTLSYGTSGNGNGRIVSVSDGTRSVAYAYDGNGDLTTITDVMGGTISYQYAGHLLTQGTDAKGNVFVRNTYDAKGRVSQQLDAAGGTTTFAYDTPGAGATRVTDQRGKQTTYYFDQQLRITDVKDHDGGVTSTVYDANSNKTSVTNPLGKTWSYTYDSRHNVLTATDPLAKVWTYTYNAKNDVLTVTDPLSRVTTYAYDTAGNLTSVTDANSKTTSFTVNANGLVTAVTDPLTHATSFVYDSYGNRTTVTNALNKTWTYAYDSFGRVTSVTDPLTHATSYTYNSANLVLTVTDPLSNVTTSTYDANGNVLTVTDANTKVTTYAYNNRDQLTSVTDAASGVMSFGYDAVGNLTTKTNPRSKTTTYTYDNLSRLKTETDPLNFVRTYNYDVGGRLTSRVDPKSQSISYTYNDRNELTNITYPDTSYTSFAYNDAGARTQMVDGTGTTSYSYDSLYRLTSVTFPGSRTVAYSYDDASRRTAITYPGGSNQVSYAYDAANRLSSVTDWNSNATSYGYDDANRMTTTTLPSGTGVVSSYSYDNANRLTAIGHVKGGTTLASASYTLDSVGNRTQRVDQQGTHSYSYDSLYRLTSVTYPGPSTTSYAFDAFGNRTSKTDGSGTTGYSYDDADRITAVTPPSPASAISYTWDNNGNLTNRGSDTFSWDYEDRMASATVNSVTTSFAYRGDGLRNSRTTGGSTTTFTWDIAGGLPVVLDDGSQYVYGAGLTAMKQSGSWFYYLADGLGSTMAIVDSAGAVQKGYTYDVYGKPTATGSLANEFDFAGQQTDATGLQYLRARYMDPETGTFMSRDPLDDLPSWISNPFVYAAGAPSQSSDPLGLCSFPAPLCWKTVDPGELGLSGGDSTHFFEALFVGNVQLPIYRACQSQPDGGKTCSPGASGADWAEWIYNNVPMAIGVTNAVMDVAEYILKHGKTKWNQGPRGTYDNDGHPGSQKLPTKDSNGDRITYTEWNAVQKNRADNSGTERIVTGSDGSAWYTNDHYATFTRLK